MARKEIRPAACQEVVTGASSGERLEAVVAELAVGVVPNAPPAEPNKTVSQPQATDKYRHLPPKINVDETVSTKDTEPVPDPEIGRDPEQDFVLRKSGI